jgi:hypothetical protein
MDPEEPLPSGPRFTWPARIVAVLAALLLIGNLFGLRARRDPPPEPTPSPTVTVSPTATPSPSGTPSGRPLASMPLGVRRVAKDVERIRGLRFLEPVDVQIVSQAQLDRRLDALVRKELDPAEIARTDRTWTTLGLLDAGEDLFQAIRDLNTGGVAGFYDEETGELLVETTSPDELSPAARYYVAHELTHALTDQHHDLKWLRTLGDVEGAADEAFAYRALAEGDAVTVAQRYLSEMSAEDIASLQREIAAQDESSLANVPAPLLEIFGWPYDAGTDFVDSLLVGDDFRRVDRAYQRRPLTTREILHPSVYPAPEPRPLDLIEVGSDWNELESEAIGEFDLALILDAAGAVSATTAGGAADGWRAGRYRTMGRAGGTVVEIAVRFGDVADLEQAADTFDDYLAELAGDGGRPYASGVWQGISGAVASGARSVEGRLLRLLVASDEGALDGYLDG